ncbi:MAG: IS91 family transposase [Chloroflexi bacterium]|nr:IS91 family transposase [Chloroflexota bacterium]
MVEMADIFLEYGPSYRAKYGDRMLPSHKKAMHAIEQCRTSALGGHVYHCLDCGEKEYQYHSCRNRHCPKCQNGKAYEWLEKQQSILLPTPYFLVTFTLPDELRDVARSNQKLIYDALFRMSAQAMQTLGADPRFVGGQMGMVGVLHTWGRNLSFHPHIHYLVPGGGIDRDSKLWLPAAKSFLFPVQALSILFRAKFRDALKDTDCFANIPADVWEKDWVVHSKPVGDGTLALKYLAPYVFRVAISNHRILDMDDGRVTFRYRDTKTGKIRTSALPAQEFIRRFLQHVLPKGFVKVRYYGFLAPGCRPRLAALRQQLVSTNPVPDSNDDLEDESGDEEQDSSDGKAVLCPSCGRPMMVQISIQPGEFFPREHHLP